MSTASVPLAFLFTDIEGSTRLWEAHPDAMQAALACHDARLRAVIAAHGGEVFKTIGDAFCVTFSSPLEAVQAALEAQRELTAEPCGALELRVRMAVHSGSAESRDGDYFGQPLNRVARLLAAGHGGQVLVSQAVQEQVKDQLPPEVCLLDLGERRLKDLAQPEHIYQLTAPGLRDDFPALRTLEAFRHNLPTQLTSFVGRVRELKELQNRLSEQRLVTLIGPGGTGKTRLAIQAATEMLDHYADGTWLVELAPVTEPAQVLRATAMTFGLRESEDRPLLQVLNDYLHGKNLLLILDNCEHVIDACASLAEALLEVNPQLHILASSREALGLTGENIFRVPSLEAPDPRHLPPWEQFSHCEAVRLFAERAAAAQPEFELTPDNGPAVAQICQRLDGIPLAIELAAARVKVLSVEQIAARLDDRFRLLTGGSRTALPRQQTLRALIDWSYDLLNEAERVLFRRLAVFSGGWTLEAAETICSGSINGQELAELEVLDLLTGLVNKSMVLTELRGGETRYRMLETIRQYTRDRLLESGESTACRNRHLQYYLNIAEQLEPELWRDRQLAALKRLDRENDNLRAALEWCLAEESGPNISAGLRIACTLPPYWGIRGLWTECNERFQTLLGYPNAEVSDRLRLKALNRAGLAAREQSNSALVQLYFGAALPLAEKLGERGEQAYALLGLHQTDESIAIFRELNDPVGLLRALAARGTIANAAGDFETAKRAFEENLALCHAIGHRVGAAGTLVALSFLGRMDNDLDAAEKAGQEALEIFRTADDRPGIGGATYMLGLVKMQRGDLDAARVYFNENMAIQNELGVVPFIGGATLILSELERLAQNYDRALELLEQCQKIFTRSQDLLNLALTYINQADILQRQGRMDEAREALKIYFASPGIDYATYGLGLLNVAYLGWQAGQAETGARFLGAFAGVPGIEQLLTPADYEQIDTVTAGLRALLTEEAYEAAYAAGRRLAQADLSAVIAKAKAYVQG
ncbi:MAG: tetratricopeptide repeat protein [Longilinea sp.]|nr:tetratricopeptide repeat protein [Longilinea sp.]